VDSVEQGVMITGVSGVRAALELHKAIPPQVKEHVLKSEPCYTKRSLLRSAAWPRAYTLSRLFCAWASCSCCAR